ncbi:MULTISPECIES: hypothetical protein [unclassified Blastococcus]
MKWLLLVVLLAVLAGVVLATTRNVNASRRPRGRRIDRGSGDSGGYWGSSYDSGPSRHHDGYDGGADSGADSGAGGGDGGGGGGGD